MRRIFYLQLIFLFLLQSSLYSQNYAEFFASGFSIHVETGYAKLKKKNDAFAETSNVGGLIQGLIINQSQNSTSQETVGESEAVPLNIEISKFAWIGGSVFGYGIQGQVFLQQPKFLVPIRGTNKVAYTEKLNSTSLGFFLQYRKRLGYSESIIFIPQLSFGRKWHTDKFEYTEEYMAINPEVSNHKKKLESSFFISADVGFSFYVGNRTELQITGKYFLRDKFREVNSITDTKLNHVQLMIGLRKHFGFECGC